nr:IS66 family transposase [Ruminococcus bovis]
MRQENQSQFLTLLCWAEKQSIAFKSKLGGAFTYLKNNEKYLRRYLEDGRLEIDNNRAERSIKPL